APDLDAYRFPGPAGDRVLVSAIPTSGPLTTPVYLSPPGGGDPVMIADDRLDYQLPQGGTYTVVVQDDDLGDAGNYNLSLLDVTSGPFTSVADANGGPIVSAAVVSGQMNAAGDLDPVPVPRPAGGS